MAATVIRVPRSQLAAALFAMTGLLGAGPTPASAQTAPLVTGLEKITGALSAVNSLSPKSSVAVCPAGKQILGGGGWAFSVSAANAERLTLTQLEPSRFIIVNGQVRHGYRVTAAETTPGLSGNWWVQAYALCANPVPGHDIVSAPTASSSLPVQATAAVCPSGKRVVGSGARINSPSPGQVVLQVARSSGPGDIARAQAHEDADGYAGLWNVVAIAVCATTPAGYEVLFAPSPQRLSETTKVAFATCPGNKQLLGAGGAISNVAPGNVSLQVVYPFNTLRPGTVEAAAVENTPTSLNWDFIVAAAICTN